MKKKPIIAFLFIFAMSIVSPIKAQMNFFEGTWAEALALAKKENKFIVLDAHTSWCGPCKKMKKEIFPQTEVGDFYNKNFINVAIDMEKGEGPELDKQYNVQFYPTFLYFNPQGELVHKTLGFKKADEFIEDGKNALDENRQYVSLQKKYRSGDRNPEMLYHYALAAEAAASNPYEITQASDAYLSAVPNEELLSDKNIDFILRTAYDKKSKAFGKMSELSTAIMEKVGKEKFISTVTNVLMNDVSEAVETDNPAQYLWAITYAQANFSEYSEQICGSLAMYYYTQREEWNEYANEAANYIGKFAMEKSNVLNNAAWTFYEHIDEPAKLEEALAWSKKSLSLENNYYNADTYAALLYKLGRKNEALRAAEEAIILGKNEGMDISETENLLEKIKLLE
ncbi:MAG: thioredoxin family protein [Chitinophagales bacterium]|nr:thioredoxin family protein [Bacteroidota bacterium]MCB9043339.1 thioredoxin family protein [Chitinophagales bacterium]